MATLALSMVSPRARGVLLFIGIALGLLCFELAVVRSAAMRHHPRALSLGVALDLTLVLPGLYYVLAVRRGRLSALSVVPIFMAMVAVVRLLLPEASRGVLQAVLLGSVSAVELGLLSVGVYKLGALRRSYRALAPTALYPTDAVTGSVRAVLGESRLVAWFVTELTLIFCALLGWSRSFRGGPTLRAFSYHRRNHYRTLLGVLLCMLVVETGVLHVALSLWSAVAAWICTALSLYGALWLLGDYQCCRLHPIVLRDGVLHLRTGLRWQVEIRLADVDTILDAESRSEDAAATLNLSAVGPPSLVVRLRRPARVRSLFGSYREARQLGLGVDDPRALQEALTAKRAAVS